MTVICGIEAGGKVYLGGDSYCGSGDGVDLCDTPKVFKVGPLGIGICGSIRCEQLFVKTLKKRIKDNKKITREWLQDALTNAVREDLSKKGSTEDKFGRQMMPDNSSFLIAFKGELYVFEDDFSLWRSPRGYMAIGAGEAFAKGALEVLAKDNSLSPAEKLQKALDASVNLCCLVKPPFTIIAV